VGRRSWPAVAAIPISVVGILVGCGQLLVTGLFLLPWWLPIWS
jgi:hypothetical protein